MVFAFVTKLFKCSCRLPYVCSNKGICCVCVRRHSFEERVKFIKYSNNTRPSWPIQSQRWLCVYTICRQAKRTILCSTDAVKFYTLYIKSLNIPFHIEFREFCRSSRISSLLVQGQPNLVSLFNHSTQYLFFAHPFPVLNDCEIEQKRIFIWMEKFVAPFVVDF